MEYAIIGQTYYLDLGSLAPVHVKVLGHTLGGHVMCKYLNSSEGRIEKLPYEFFKV